MGLMATAVSLTQEIASYGHIQIIRPTSIRRKEGALEACSAGERNRPGPSGTLSPAKQWDSGQLVARVVVDHSRPLEMRPGGGGAALSVCRNLVGAASFTAGVCGACHGVAKQSSSCRMIRNDTLHAPWGAMHVWMNRTARVARQDAESFRLGLSGCSEGGRPQGDKGQRPGQAESAANRRRLVRCDGVDVQVHLPQVGEARNSSGAACITDAARAGLVASVRLREPVCVGIVVAVTAMGPASGRLSREPQKRLQKRLQKAKSMCAGAWRAGSHPRRQAIRVPGAAHGGLVLAWCYTRHMVILCIAPGYQIPWSFRRG